MTIKEFVDHLAKFECSSFYTNSKTRNNTYYKQRTQN